METLSVCELMQQNSNKVKKNNILIYKIVDCLFSRCFWRMTWSHVEKKEILSGQAKGKSKLTWIWDGLIQWGKFQLNHKTFEGRIFYHKHKKSFEILLSGQTESKLYEVWMSFSDILFEFAPPGSEFSINSVNWNYNFQRGRNTRKWRGRLAKSFRSNVCNSHINNICGMCCRALLS